ncbi:hypothetical protein ACHAXS_001578, partial [Conticribra weissflogii]
MWTGLNVVARQHFLKVDANEFGSVFEDCDARTRVTTEPVFVEELGGVDGRLVEHWGKFDPTGASVDHGEEVDVLLQDFV